MASNSGSFTTIDHFLSNSFLKEPEGFLRPSRFKIEFTNWMSNDVIPAEFKDVMSNNLVSMTIPGFSISDDNSSPLRHSITTRDTGDITMVFWESSTFGIRQNIFKWMDSIVQHKNDVENQHRAYINDIVVNLKVYPLTNSGETGKICDEFLDVFPINAGDITYDYSDDNQIAQTTVQWRYRYHNILSSNSTAVQ